MAEYNLFRHTMRSYLPIILLVAVCLTARSQTNEPPKKSPAEVMRELRLRMLTSSPSDWGLKPTAEYPRVYGVLMDWPIDPGTVSVVSLSTGDASIYTTGSFGVIGGIAHKSVRKAAQNFVKDAENHYAESTPTTEYPYPQPGRIRFYLVCYDGVRMIDADLETARSGADKCSDLYGAGQAVITELRLISDKPKAGKK
jgi:hypothetical protein